MRSSAARSVLQRFFASLIPCQTRFLLYSAYIPSWPGALHDHCETVKERQFSEGQWLFPEDNVHEVAADRHPQRQPESRLKADVHNIFIDEQAINLARFITS